VKGFMVPIMKGLMTPLDPSRANVAVGTRAHGWCRNVVVSQWPLRNTARPRRSPATPAPGSAFMSSLGPWPSIDGRRRCDKSRLGDR
jgi:hypothetical protein